MEEINVAPKQSVDVAGLVKAVADSRRALHCSIVLRLFTGEQARDPHTAELLSNVLGEAGPKLVEDFTAAKSALTRALIEQCNLTAHAANEHLKVLLSCGAVSENDGWHTFNDVDGGQVTAKVLSIEGARIQPDGHLWGLFRVSESEHSSTSWSFEWRENSLTVRSKD
ncbi:hypothetical protein AB4Y45_33880 [Paraburkholderia sp. EG287A]|uniref:hypothetical protein n=1 Tax=Paraburkholderia sp. EG287A TaxID=3237012 RepID=UPI0034D216D8